MNISLPEDATAGMRPLPLQAWVEQPHSFRPGGEIDLRSMAGLLRRQARLIIATSLAIVALVAIAAFSLTPVYTASVLVLVDPSRKNLLDPAAQMAGSPSDSARVDSEVEILRSDSVLMDVIAAKNLVADGEFGVKLGWREKLMALFRLAPGDPPAGGEALGTVREALRQALSVQRRGLTYVISVEISSVSPHKAAELANAVAQSYIRRQIESKIEGTHAARDAVQGQIDRAREAVVAAERQFNGFITENLDLIVAVTGRSDLAEIRNAMSASTAARANAAEEAQSLRRTLGEGDFGALAESLQSDAARELERQRLELRRALARTAADGQAAVNLRQELEKIETSLVEAARSRVTELEGAIADSEAALASARQELNAALSQVELPPDILARIYELQQVSRNATANYQALLARFQDLETQSSLQVADSRIVSPALPPEEASFPDVSLFLSIAAVFALASGVGLGFLFENYVGGFTSSEQVEAVLRRPLAALLPRQRSEAGAATVADALVESPLSRYSESVRRLRASIDRCLGAGGWTPSGRPKGAVVMVSSALPAEGKTTVALSLARAYALAGRRTIIIDCDLRKPSIHKHLELEPSTGLVDYLSGALQNNEFPRVVMSDVKTSLTAIVGARRADLPTDQLVTKRSFAQLMAAATKMFDYVIIDTPPVEPIVDGLYLAEHADVIAFVVQWASTPQRVAISALEALTAAKRHEVEIVVAMNQEDGKGRSYASAYSSYYTE